MLTKSKTHKRTKKDKKNPQSSSLIASKCHSGIVKVLEIHINFQKRGAFFIYYYYCFHLVTMLGEKSITETNPVYIGKLPKPASLFFFFNTLVPPFGLHSSRHFHISKFNHKNTVTSHWWDLNREPCSYCTYGDGPLLPVIDLSRVNTQK